MRNNRKDNEKVWGFFYKRFVHHISIFDILYIDIFYNCATKSQNLSTIVNKKLTKIYSYTNCYNLCLTFLLTSFPFFHFSQ